MAVVFMDGFDFYNTNAFAILHGWHADTAISSFPTGRFGGLAARPGGSSVLRIDVAAQQTYIVTFAVLPSTLPASTVTVLQLMDGATVHIDIRLTATGTLEITRNGTVLATSTAALLGGIWYHLQVKVTIHDSTGAYEVRLDGANILSASGVDTRNAGNASVDRIQFRGTGVGLTYDDIAILDTTGSLNNDFPGEGKISILMPTGAGNYTQFTPSAGSNWQNVDDAAPNNDTDYNSSSTANQIDTFNRTSIAVTGAILAVKHTTTHRKDDVGTREIAQVCRSGTTDYVGSTKTCLSTYKPDSSIREVDPDTSAAWTESGLNAAEFGYKVIT